MIIRFSLTNSTQRQNRQESEKFQIQHGDEIKISDYYLVIEEINVNKHVTDLYNLCLI